VYAYDDVSPPSVPVPAPALLTAVNPSAPAPSFASPSLYAVLQDENVDGDHEFSYENDDEPPPHTQPEQKHSHKQRKKKQNAQPAQQQPVHPLPQQQSQHKESTMPTYSKKKRRERFLDLMKRGFNKHNKDKKNDYTDIVKSVSVKCFNAVLGNPTHAGLDEEGLIALLVEVIHLNAPERSQRAWNLITTGEIRDILTHQLKGNLSELRDVPLESDGRMYE